MNLPQETVHYEALWAALQRDFGLLQGQVNQLKRYAQLLIEWNEKFNLTALLDIPSIIHYHFYDSLKIADFVDFNAISAVADIGSGAGFPGIPLKILFPHVSVMLIEVNHKKRTFLQHIIQEFALDNVCVVGDDWRTFLRTTSYTIDYFLARASLQPEELVRIFKPSCVYRNATLVYWASEKWMPGTVEAPFVKNEIGYTIDDIQRRYVFFKV